MGVAHAAPGADSGADLPDLRAIKADPRVFAIMLGGVRSWQQTAEELAADVVAWGANGFGIWTIRAATTRQSQIQPLKRRAQLLERPSQVLKSPSQPLKNSST